MSETIAAKTRYPLNPYPMALAGREWQVLNTKLVFTRDEETDYFARAKTGLPYGVALWPSSLALAYELASQAESLAGKTLLELGAGVGLPGLIARHLGAEVVQTDFDSMALSVCELNAQVNQIEGIEWRQADWREFEDQNGYDFIIGSDILYGVPLHPHLKDIFQTRLAPGGHVLIADPSRMGSTEFFDDLHGLGWAIEVSDWRMDLSNDGEPRLVYVYDLQPPSLP